MSDLVPLAEIDRLCREVLLAAGLAPDDAVATATGLTGATALGLTSHGLSRLPQYVTSIQAGEINRHPDVRVALERGATALIEADGGYGFRPSFLAVEIGVRLAKSHGVGIVGVRNSHHFGAAAIHVRRAAEAAQIAICCSTSAPRIVPTGGRTPVIGNNPIAVAVPRTAAGTPPSARPPLVVDFALGSVAIGRLREAARSGTAIPLGWGYDAAGQPTEDPNAIIDGGSLAPAAGHKGFGLALAVEVLAGVLTGSPFGLAAHPHQHPHGGVGHLFIVIEPTIFGSLADFQAALTQLEDQVHGSGTGTRLPGDKSTALWEKSHRSGVRVSATLRGLLDEVADRLGVDPLRAGA